MSRSFHAELIKLRRRRVLTIGAGELLLFAVVSVLATILPADADGGGAASLADMEAAGGMTEAFSAGAGFTGILVFVLFIANVGSEFSQGTFRSMALRQPDRLSLLGGKLAALMLFAAGALAVALVLTSVLSALVAPSQDIAVGQWLTADGLGTAAVDLGRVLLTWTGWAVLGTTLAVLLRSVPVALGVGIAWTGPFEHLLTDAWRSGLDWMPGLQLEQLAAGDALASSGVAMLTAVALAAAAAAALTVQRRDVGA